MQLQDRICGWLEQLFDRREFCNSHPYIISGRSCKSFPESLAQLSSVYYRHRAHGFSNILLASHFYVNWDSRNTKSPYTALVIEKNKTKRILDKSFQLSRRMPFCAQPPLFGAERFLFLAILSKLGYFIRGLFTEQ